MERKITITCPISVGDKIYRLDKAGNILIETIKDISVKANEYMCVNGSKESFDKHITIMFNTNANRYGTHQLGEEIFLDKKEIIQKLVNQL